MDQGKALKADLLRLVRQVQSLPYVWPCPPDAASARATRTGTCASKHALVAEELASLGIQSAPLLVTGPLVPASLADEPQFAPARRLIEVHECLTVFTPWAGPVRVDVTWDPPLIARGLPGTLDWDGRSDMTIAVGETGAGWSVLEESLREAKEAVRARLYGPGEREIRDAILARLAQRFAGWRCGED